MPDQALAALRELTEAVMAEFFGNDTNLSKRLIKATNEAQLLLMVQPPDDDLANHHAPVEPGLVERLPDGKPYPNPPAPVEPATFALQWSKNRPPCEKCRYDHCKAETPFGSFLITWKSWKEYDSPTVDETPWGDSWEAFATVELAKAACQREFDTRLALCGLNHHAPVEPAELTDQELLRTYNEELLQTYNARNYINEERVRAATIAGLRAVIAADRAWRATPPAPAEPADDLIGYQDFTELCAKHNFQCDDDASVETLHELVQEAIAADRARRATPPAEGEVGLLAEWMSDHAAHLRNMEKIGALPQTELPARLDRAAALLKQQAAELALLRQLAAEIRALVSESDGVAGLHLNGDLAPWDELLPGGRFERLTSLPSEDRPHA